MNEEFEFTLHAPNSPVFGRFFAGIRPACAQILAQPCIGGRRHLGWSGWGSIWPVVGRGRRRSEAEKGKNRGDVKQKQKQKEEGGLSGGCHDKGGGEIRAREFTVLPFPSLFHLFDSPNLNC